MKIVLARFAVSLFMAFGLVVPTFGVFSSTYDSTNVRIDDSGVFMQCSPITQLSWGGPDFTTMSHMFGTCSGGWSLFAGNNAAQITMVPGNGNTQYWYLTGYQNNRGVRIYNDQTIVENQLVANGDFTVEGNSFLAGTVEASNFSGASSGINTGDQTFTSVLTGSGESGTVLADSSAFMGPGTSNTPALLNADVANVLPSECSLHSFYVTTRSAQPGSGNLTFTLRVDSVFSGVQIIIPAGSPAGTYSDVSDTVDSLAGAKVSVRVVNSATAASAKIGPWSLGCSQ